MDYRREISGSYHALMLQFGPAELTQPRQAASLGTALVFGAGLVVYQLTSLVLAPQTAREFQVSASIPAVDVEDLAEPVGIGAEFALLQMHAKHRQLEAAAAAVNELGIAYSLVRAVVRQPDPAPAPVAAISVGQRKPPVRPAVPGQGATGQPAPAINLVTVASKAGVLQVNPQPPSGGQSAGNDEDQDGT
jgi:hypothetical protein